MKAIKMSCPSCNASLNIEKGRDFCFCTYCGEKIYLDDEVKRVEITQNINKNINYHKTYTDEARIKDIEAKERMQDKKYKAESNKTKMGLIIGIICVVGYLIVVGGFFGSEKRESDKQEEQLQELTEEIMLDIKNGNLTEAKIKAETLYYTAGWSSEIEDKWDSTREELIEQIEKTEKEANPDSDDGGTWWNPFD